VWLGYSDFLRRTAREFRRTRNMEAEGGGSSASDPKLIQNDVEDIRALFGRVFDVLDLDGGGKCTFRFFSSATFYRFNLISFNFFSKSAHVW